MRMKKVSELLAEEKFDGIVNPYIPSEQLKISSKLKIQRSWDRKIDPITYEVVRHNLFNINEEHGATIQRISGSPVAIFALDLNPSILTEDAEFVYFGPYMQYMSGVTDTQVKWVLENRSENPGIRDGDMFLANDPWVGAAHQMDVMLMCPVFWEGELFCWVTNCLHQYDIGGITPSSFCPSAESVFDEGIMIPPIKIIENFEIKSDVEDLYLRSSRRRDMVALDLRAQIAGNTTARERILTLLRRYGPKVVKGVMKKIIENGEAAFLQKMNRLPDGVWQERSYVECCRPGDRKAYRVILTMRKNGSQLIFENEGTAPQDGAMNATYSGWRGSIMVALNQLLCWDQDFAVGGALRHVEFNPTLGTFTCARHPASVSTAPVQAMEIALYPTYNVISKMIHCDTEMRKDIMCIGGSSQFATSIYSGTNQWGENYGYVAIEPLAGAIGAFSTGDGINTGGQSRTPICMIPNVEHTEQMFPLLILYRKELPNSGGAGKFRGGLSGEVAFIPHRTEKISHAVISSGAAIPTSIGMMGGYPASTNNVRLKTETDIRHRLEESLLISDLSELLGENVVLPLRADGIVQQLDDVYAIAWCGAGGFGDPMLREPEAVMIDIETDAISPEVARDIYSVVCIEDQLSEKKLQVDFEATTIHRNFLRDQRVRNSAKKTAKADGQKLLELTDRIHVRIGVAGAAVYCCADCATTLAPLGENYKAGCLQESSLISASNTRIGDPTLLIDDKPEFRQFFCPGCGTLIENELCLVDDPVLDDIHIEHPHFK